MHFDKFIYLFGIFLHLWKIEGYLKLTDCLFIVNDGQEYNLILTFLFYQTAKWNLLPNINNIHTCVFVIVA